MRSFYVFMILCCLAALAPFASKPGADGGCASDACRWPSTFEGRPLRALALSDKERAFEKGFPGHMVKFTDGSRIILMRRVTAATRKLHAASDCFQGIGYSVRPLPLVSGPGEDLWGSVECKRGTEVIRVREQIVDESGSAWTDVSAWYWAALLGRTRGPWCATTVVEGYAEETDSRR